jgi:YfiH family protein
MKLESPLLAAIPGLRHGFFTRHGGVSGGIYESLNAGVGSNDDPADVAENRRRMAAAIGVEPSHFLSVHQTHSADVALAGGPWPNGARPLADAIVTREEGLAIGATAADCGPVLLVDPKARVIGAAHAGWKGALTGILETTIDTMQQQGARTADMVAAIGPLIRQPSYEVGDEFVERFIAADANNALFFLPAARQGHAMFDLGGFIRMRLQNKGVPLIDDTGLDTYADARFFSYRRSVHRGEPDYGRHIHAIALEPNR